MRDSMAPERVRLTPTVRGASHRQRPVCGQAFVTVHAIGDLANRLLDF